MGNDVAEACLKEALGDGCADGHGVALAQRAGGVLDAAHHVHFGVAGRGAAPLAELLELVEGELAGECEHGVEHGRHVAGVEEEAVAEGPLRVVGVGYEVLGIKHSGEIGTAHCATGVAGLCFFHHGSCKYADIVGRTCEKFLIHWLKWYVKVYNRW